MPLQLESLQKALTTLERSINISLSEEKMAGLDDATQEIIRAGVIQHFEFSYELCWKFIQRWLKENRSPEEVENARTRKDLFRLAAANGLIENPEDWFRFAEARNITSHIYDEDKADAVYETALQFLKPALFLLRQLESKND